MNCVKSVRFAVVINGKPGRYFSPSRGIRQGDPISPYLFLMISEVLSLLIKHACNANLIQGIRLAPGGPLLSHLLFADDTLLFLKANEQNCHNITRILHDFCLASGQQVSLEKSSVYLQFKTFIYFS
ncbi:unnamed protein product [Prunus brigantina]